MELDGDEFRYPISFLVNEKIHPHIHIQTQQVSSFFLIPPYNEYILVPVSILVFLLFQY